MNELTALANQLELKLREKLEKASKIERRQELSQKVGKAFNAKSGLFSLIEEIMEPEKPKERNK